MPESRDRLCRTVDVTELYRIRRRLGGGGRRTGGGEISQDPDEVAAVGTPFRWGSIPLTGPPPSETAAGGFVTPVRRRTESEIRRTGGSVPCWNPRRPLHDPTYIQRLYLRRELEKEAGTAVVEPNNNNNNGSMITPLVPKPPKKLVHKLPKKLIDAQDGELMTLQQKLLHSIEIVERVYEEEMQKYQRTVGAKKAEREKKEFRGMFS